jgi:hypothetical protein
MPLMRRSVRLCERLRRKDAPAAAARYMWPLTLGPDGGSGFNRRGFAATQPVGGGAP